MTAATCKAERKYLLREGHALGFMMGVVLSQRWPLAVLWGCVVMTLWARSLFADPGVESEGRKTA